MNVVSMGAARVARAEERLEIMRNQDGERAQRLRSRIDYLRSLYLKPVAAPKSAQVIPFRPKA